jgi:hypothetical protein
MAAIQELAKKNQVKVTVFDASKPATRAGGAPPPPAIGQSSDSIKASGNEDPPPRPVIQLNERRIPAQITGTHTAVARFIRDVAQYPRIIYVSDITITALNREESVNLTLITYDAPTAGNLPPFPKELQREFQTVEASGIK